MKIIKVKNQKGFSLIEMMVVVVILGLIVLGLVTFFTGGAKSWVAGQSQLEAQRNARQAMDQMVREIRETDYIEPNSTSSSIYFHTPFDGSISYSLIIRDLKRGSNPIINNIQSLNFKYFDNLEPPVEIIPPLTSETASKISKVNIDLKVDVDKDSKPDITLNTDVNLRNYGLLE
ncbi:MAG: prepilin-type N-terminal cleavage/methylation domain-containing protein [Actinobacteria bacterium]|nr:prepilin-type N-terminal cleavage/methylation domain-containing protein [Actinomycetota bacterium]